jgi:hypothetical protein
MVSCSRGIKIIAIQTHSENIYMGTYHPMQNPQKVKLLKNAILIKPQLINLFFILEEKFFYVINNPLLQTVLIKILIS